MTLRWGPQSWARHGRWGLTGMEENRLPLPAGCTSDAAQDAAALLPWKRTLLA